MFDFPPPPPPRDLLTGRFTAPEKRLLGSDGRPIDDDAGFLLGHQKSFSSIWSSINKTYYWKYDEAIKHSQENVLAMRRDSFIMGCLQERYLQLAMLPFHLEPEDQKDPVQKAVSDEMTRIIKSTKRWTQFVYQHAEAIWYGRYANQVKWGPVSINGKKRLAVIDHRPVNGDKIQYGYDGTPKIMIHHSAMGELIAKNKVKKEDVQFGGRAPMLCLKDPRWRERFIIHKHNCNDADYFDGEMAGGVHGVGVRSLIYWGFWLRDEMLGWAINHLKKIGVGGILVFYYEEGNPASEDAAEKAAQDAGERYAIAMPRPRGSAKDTNHAELLSFNESGVNSITSIIQDYFERHIERLIIGQTLSSKAEGTGLGSGVATFQADTKWRILKFDSNNLADSYNEDFIPVIKRWDFSNINFNIKMVFDVPDPQAEQKLEAAGIVFQTGGEIKKDELLQAAGFSKPEKDDDTVSQLKLLAATTEIQLKAQIEGAKAQGQMQMEMQQEQGQQQLAMQQAQGLGMGGQTQAAGSQPPGKPPKEAPAAAGAEEPQQPAPQQVEPEPAANSVDDIVRAMMGEKVDLDVPAPPEKLSPEAESLFEGGGEEGSEAEGSETEGPSEKAPPVKEEAGVTYASTHAPKGGITIGGTDFAGGQFIPGAILAKASPEEKAQLAGKKAASGENVPSMPADGGETSAPERQHQDALLKSQTSVSEVVVAPEEWDAIVEIAVSGDGKKLKPLKPEAREPVLKAMRKFIGMTPHEFAVAQGVAYEKDRSANRTMENVFDAAACRIIAKYRGSRSQALWDQQKKSGIPLAVTDANKYTSKQVEKFLRNPGKMRKEVENSTFLKKPIYDGTNAAIGFNPEREQNVVNRLPPDKRHGAQRLLDAKKTATAFLSNHAGDLMIHAIKVGMGWIPKIVEIAASKGSKPASGSYKLQDDDFSMGYQGQDQQSMIADYLRDSFAKKLSESGLEMPPEMANELIEEEVAKYVPVLMRISSSQHTDNPPQKEFNPEVWGEQVHTVAINVTGDAMAHFMRSGRQFSGENAVVEVALWLRDRVKNRLRRSGTDMPELVLEELATNECLQVAPAIVNALASYKPGQAAQEPTEQAPPVKDEAAQVAPMVYFADNGEMIEYADIGAYRKPGNPTREGPLPSGHVPLLLGASTHVSGPEHPLGLFSIRGTGRMLTPGGPTSKKVPEGHEFVDAHAEANPMLHAAFASIPPNSVPHLTAPGQKKLTHAGHVLPEGLIDDATFHPHWQQIAAEPQNDFHKLVLADRLEEHGHGDFAQHLREHFDPSSPKFAGQEKPPQTMQDATTVTSYVSDESEVGSDDRPNEYPKDYKLFQEILGIIPKQRTYRLPRLIGSVDGGVKVLAVDGDAVKERLYMDFVEGGNDIRYEFIPKGQIWIDNTMDLYDWPYVIYHEVNERRLMSKGMSYDKAHAISNRVEDDLRRKYGKKAVTRAQYAGGAETSDEGTGMVPNPEGPQAM